MKTKVGVNRFNVETDDLLPLTSDDEGESNIGTKSVPEDIS